MDRQLSKAIDLLRYPMAVLVAMCHCGFLGGGATAAQIFFSETLPHVGKAARACPPAPPGRDPLRCFSLDPLC